MELAVSPFLVSDLARVGTLQPEAWPNILPHFEFYCNSNFCFPLKAEKQGKLVGIGVAIIHGKTAWMAHIIVAPENRNQGIGKIITQSLIEFIQNTPCSTIQLLATKLGEPVYGKLGFLPETEYLFFKDGKQSSTPTNEVLPYNNRFENSILLLDQRISGENREQLLKPHLEKSLIIVDNNNVVGCFFQTLGEGLILAESKEAGLVLLRQKHLTELRTALPEENKNGVNFLVQNGFQKFGSGMRMRLGKKLAWQPEKIYSRIGGNLG